MWGNEDGVNFSGYPFPMRKKRIFCVIILRKKVITTHYFALTFNPGIYYSLTKSKLLPMYITFEELRRIKHALPTGSVKRIADELHLEEQTVRNYFGAKKYENGQIVSQHIQPGPDGGIVSLEDETILKVARRIIEESTQSSMAHN